VSAVPIVPVDVDSSTGGDVNLDRFWIHDGHEFQYIGVETLTHFG
jgi:hypothetical protein